MPPSASIPRWTTRVASIAVTYLFAFTRMRCQATSSSVAEPSSIVATRSVSASDEASAACDSAFITARFSRTSGKAPIGRPNADAHAGEARRFEVRAAHQPGRAERVQPARGVEDDARRDPEAVFELAQREGNRAVELDLARRERPRAELVLQAADAEAVDRPVHLVRNEEARDPRGAGRRTVGTSRDDELVGIGDRAEPLLAREPPRLAVTRRRDRVGADVRAALPLGQELRAALRAVVVALEERRQEPFAQLVGGVSAQRPHEAGRADDGAGVPALAGVGQEVEEGSLLVRRRRDDARRPHRSPGDLVRRIEDDPVAVGHRAVASRLELRDRRVDHPRNRLAELAEPVDPEPVERRVVEGVRPARLPLGQRVVLAGQRHRPSAARLARLWPGAKTSTCGRAARIPRASGS